MSVDRGRLHAHPGEERRAGRRTSTPGPRRSDRRRGSAAPASARRPRRPRRRSSGRARRRSPPRSHRGSPRAEGQRSARKTGRPSSPMPERLAREVEVDPPGQGEGDDERRRGQVAGPGEGVDPALEVAVAREDGRRDEPLLLDLVGDRLVERARVADAGRAAVAGQGEAERREGSGEAGALQVGGHRLGAGRQRRLHGRRDPQAPRDRVPGQEAGPDHDGRVRGVRARGDRGDDDRAVADGARRRRRRRTPGGSPGRRPRSWPGSPGAARGPGGAAGRRGWARRSPRSSSTTSSNAGPGARLAPEALLLRVALHEVDERRPARPVRRR